MSSPIAVLAARNWPARASKWAFTTSSASSPTVHVECREFRGKLDLLPVKRGTQRLLKDVQFRKQNPVTQHVAVCWKKGLPKDRDECWFLMTDLSYSVKKLTDLYGRRMTIEELFRDEKNRRHGWALRNTQITRAERFDRLLLILDPGLLAAGGHRSDGLESLSAADVVQQQSSRGLRPVLHRPQNDAATRTHCRTSTFRFAPGDSEPRPESGDKSGEDVPADVRNSRTN